MGAPKFQRKKITTEPRLLPHLAVREMLCLREKWFSQVVEMQPSVSGMQGECLMEKQTKQVDSFEKFDVKGKVGKMGQYGRVNHMCVLLCSVGWVGGTGGDRRILCVGE